MKETASQADVTGKKVPIRGKCARPISSPLQRFSQRGIARHASTSPPQPRHGLHILKVVLRRILAGYEGGVRRKTPGTSRHRVLEKNPLPGDAINLGAGWSGIVV